MPYFLLSLGAVAGALLRFFIGARLNPEAGTSFPTGTLLINLAGSLILGMVMRFAESHGGTENLRMLVAVGFCGSFTTFSTFSYETFALFRTGNAGLALTYALISMIAGLLTCWLGWAVMGRAA